VEQYIMLSKSAARAFFVVGTVLCSGAFALLTVDTIKRVPAQTNEQNLSEAAIRGKHLWDRNNCMGCHTLMGEGGYYAPELTKVYERRGAGFITAMIKNPSSMYPGERKMQQYDLNDQEISDLVAFLKWIGEMDLNDFPAKPQLITSVVVSSDSSDASLIAKKSDRPMIFNQMCIACHSLEGQGGSVGPALDGVGQRLDRAYIERWLTDPMQVKSDSKMPKLPLSKEDIVELSAFLSQLK
jgi:nitric oxide reductase subunit C